MEWIKKHLAMLVIVGALADTAVFATQGYQISILNSQQRQLTQVVAAQTAADQKSRCWARVLDSAITKTHANTPTASERTVLLKAAEKCRVLP